MRKKPELNSWGSKQALAILAVDSIQPSEHALDALKRIEEGLITHEQANDEILRRAKAMVSASKEDLMDHNENRQRLRRAFDFANAIVKLEGGALTTASKAIQERVIDGEITFDQAVKEVTNDAIARSK